MTFIFLYLHLCVWYLWQLTITFLSDQKYRNTWHLVWNNCIKPATHWHHQTLFCCFSRLYNRFFELLFVFPSGTLEINLASLKASTFSSWCSPLLSLRQCVLGHCLATWWISSQLDSMHFSVNCHSCSYRRQSSFYSSSFYSSFSELHDWMSLFFLTLIFILYYDKIACVLYRAYLSYVL